MRHGARTETEEILQRAVGDQVSVTGASGGPRPADMPENPRTYEQREEAYLGRVAACRGAAPGSGGKPA